MVLPSSHHVPLSDWLRREHGVTTHELAGVLVTGDLGGLLATAGSSYRLSAADRVLLAAARTSFDAIVDLMRPMTPPQVDLMAAVRQPLVDVCAALGRAGVDAVPYEGLGVIFGAELLTGQVQVNDPAGLYELMRSGSR